MAESPDGEIRPVESARREKQQKKTRLVDDNFRLQPRKPKQVRDATATAFKAIIVAARHVAMRAKHPGFSTRLPLQNCTVKIKYASTMRATPWLAHGQYLIRDTAQGHSWDSAGVRSPDVPLRLEHWQLSGDARRWHIIISPENGKQMDLDKLANEVMSQIEKDLRKSENRKLDLEWIAAVHRNTLRPHIHVALRGVDRQGKAFRIPPQYVCSGIRRYARERCTAQLGYRQEKDLMKEQGQDRKRYGLRELEPLERD